jgi:hypothetical protein
VLRQYALDGWLEHNTFNVRIMFFPPLIIDFAECFVGTGFKPSIRPPGPFTVSSLQAAEAPFRSYPVSHALLSP